MEEKYPKAKKSEEVQVGLVWVSMSSYHSQNALQPIPKLGNQI
jgi:hypothetical protein